MYLEPVNERIWRLQHPGCLPSAISPMKRGISWIRRYQRRIGREWGDDYGGVEQALDDLANP